MFCCFSYPLIRWKPPRLSLKGAHAFPSLLPARTVAYIVRSWAVGMCRSYRSRSLACPSALLIRVIFIVLRILKTVREGTMLIELDCMGFLSKSKIYDSLVSKGVWFKIIQQPNLSVGVLQSSSSSNPFRPPKHPPEPAHHSFGPSVRSGLPAPGRCWPSCRWTSRWTTGWRQPGWVTVGER